MQRRKLLRLLSNSFVLEMLSRILRQPARFGELAAQCPSARLRSLRLSELERGGIVVRRPRMEGGKVASEYALTPRGERAVRHATQM